MTIWITTNGRPSNGAKELAKQSGFKRDRTGKFIKPKDKLVNWGSSQPIHNFKFEMQTLNDPSSVFRASNKLQAFVALKADNVKTVEWTDDMLDAENWHDAEHVVVCRTKLTGHSGDGIIIVDKEQPVPIAPLYTKYIFKEKEYRVHVVCGKVIDTQRKIKDPTKEVTCWKVRSHANGFIFARNNIDASSARDNLAIASIAALGLDFGAVDIIQDKKGTYFVLEVNTAPGLEGLTINKYAEAFREIAL